MTFFIYFRGRKEPSGSLAEVVGFIEGAFRLLRRIQRLDRNNGTAVDADNILQT